MILWITLGYVALTAAVVGSQWVRAGRKPSVWAVGCAIALWPGWIVRRLSN